MATQKRNYKMFEMRNKGSTFEEIAKRFKLSSERIRQIITNEPNFCIQHNSHFSTVCPYCFIESEYEEKLSKLSIKELIDEGKKLSKTRRIRLEMVKKKIFIRLLRNKFKYSFVGLGRLLKRDHTTIMASYY